MTATLQDKTVVITGGSSGIGLATAQMCSAAGAKDIVLIGRSSERLKAAIELVGRAARSIALDVTNETEVERVFKNIGEFDHLVTAAAGTYRGRVTELDTTAARALFESKYWGQHHCVKYGAPLLRQGGSITLFSGFISRKPAIGTSTLAAIDAAIEALARVLSLELAPQRVNAINPGQIDTPLWAARFNEQEQKEHFLRVSKDLPVGRAGTAEDIAEGVMFLVTNGFVTGSVLDIDGGQPWGRHT
jgi:NAD(P)-dependent dehydrogenase (short-subunit alcohol dehydrogenase family)